MLDLPQTEQMTGPSFWPTKLASRVSNFFTFLNRMERAGCYCRLKGALDGHNSIDFSLDDLEPHSAIPLADSAALIKVSEL